MTKKKPPILPININANKVKVIKKIPPENHESFLNRLKLKVTSRELILIDWAYINAKYAHRNQKRDDGSRYFDHLRATALILIDELKIFDTEMIIAALMHDILEDSFLFDAERIKILFGKEVAKMVTALSMPEMDIRTFKSKKDRLRHYHRTIKDSPFKVIIIKLCDRLHNLRTMKTCTPEKRKRKTKETLDHYLPLIKLLNNDYPETAKIFYHEYEKSLDELKKTT